MTNDLERVLRSLVYERNGKWFIGYVGDEDVTDIVGKALDTPTKAPTCNGCLCELEEPFYCTGCAREL